MSSAASGAADFPPPADTTEGRRRPSPGQIPTKPASKPSGSRSSSSAASKLGGKGIKGREGEQAAQGARVVRVRGAAAVHGAEAEAVWETEERIDRTPSPDTSRALHFPCVHRDSCSEQAGGGVRGRERQSEAAAGGEYVGCGPAFWGGGLSAIRTHPVSHQQALEEKRQDAAQSIRRDATGTGTGRTGRE